MVCICSRVFLRRERGGGLHLLPCIPASGARDGLNRLPCVPASGVRAWSAPAPVYFCVGSAGVVCICSRMFLQWACEEYRTAPDSLCGSSAGRIARPLCGVRPQRGRFPAVRHTAGVPADARIARRRRANCQPQARELPAAGVLQALGCF